MSTKLEKQIIQRMDGKTTFGKIGQEFGLSYQTIKSIADANGIERPKSKSFTDRLENKVLELIKAGNPMKIVMKKTKLTNYMVNKIAKKNNISIAKINGNIKSKRNEELVEAINTSGLTYREIGAKYDVSKARVHELAKKNGISRWEISRKKKQELADKINADYKSGFSYSEIVDRNDLTNVDLNALKAFGCESVVHRYRKERNSKIISEYKIKTAKSVLNSNDPVLNNPERIVRLGSIYAISSRGGFKKYPNIGNRSGGGVFERPEVIKFIKEKRDKNNLTFSEISALLRDKGFKTPYGRDYTTPNVYQKYKAIKKHNK